MREINRVIVAAIIFSKDNKMLLGRKDPKGGGVYPNSWHIPGGGVENGETFEQAIRREVLEEVGIDINHCRIEQNPIVGHGTSEKTLKETGETVLCHMEFNHFTVYIDQNANKIPLNLADDLVEAKWFSRTDLETIQQIPGGREMFQEMGYID